MQGRCIPSGPIDVQEELQGIFVEPAHVRWFSTCCRCWRVLWTIFLKQSPFSICSVHFSDLLHTGIKLQTVFNIAYEFKVWKRSSFGLWFL